MKPKKPGPRHQRSLNVDFSLCGLRRADGITFAPSTRRVTCPTCQQRQAEGRKAAAARLDSNRPVFCKLHNKVHTVDSATRECAPGAWKEPKGDRYRTETP